MTWGGGRDGGRRRRREERCEGGVVAQVGEGEVEAQRAAPGLGRPARAADGEDGLAVEDGVEAERAAVSVGAVVVVLVVQQPHGVQLGDLAGVVVGAGPQPDLGCGGVTEGVLAPERQPTHHPEAVAGQRHVAARQVAALGGLVEPAPTGGGGGAEAQARVRRPRRAARRLRLGPRGQAVGRPLGRGAAEKPPPAAPSGHVPAQHDGRGHAAAEGVGVGVGCGEHDGGF